MSFVKAFKKFFCISGLLFASIMNVFSASAQEITAIDFNGEPLGKVISDGKAVSFDNRLLGSVTADSLIVNTKGDIIGGVVPQGIAIGNDIRFLGKVGSDGVVRNPSGQAIGKVLPNGLVINEFYDILGQVIFPGLVYNDDGKISGRITGDGLYANLAGQPIGVVTPDGYAYRKVGNDYILDGRLISSKMVVSLTGEFVGSVVPGGLVSDFNSEIIGRIKANGFAYNESNQVIGKIVNSGYAFDNNGYYLGFISYNGEVINSGKIVGKVRADGWITGVNGNIIGVSTDFYATATDFSGRYIGRLLPDGSIAKTNTMSGLVGVDSKVFNASGDVLGAIIKTGPVFDFKGTVVGHSLSNGSVVSLNGTTIGYMIGKEAFNLSGVKIGAVLPPKAVYSSDNKFLGVSGVSSTLSYGNEKYSVSPFGYVFSSTGALDGKTQNINAFYSVSGATVGYLGLNGFVINQFNTTLGKTIGFGFAIDEKNQIVAKEFKDFVALGYSGELLGDINDQNKILDKNLKPVAKILPDGSVVEGNSGASFAPKIGYAYHERIALDFAGNIIGYANVLGHINNNAGAKVGQIVDRSLVVDNNGILVGFLSDYSGVANNKCEHLGVVTPSGNVCNYRDVYVGKILSNGDVISDSGSVLGKMISKSPYVDFNGRVIGFSDYKGNVFSNDGSLLGCSNLKAQLRDANGSLIARSISYDSVMDFDGKIIGYSTINGQVVDNKNSFIGYIQPNDNINSTTGVPLGALFKYKVAFSMDNKLLGYVASNGKVYSTKKEVIGQVDFDGYVISDGDKIGYALYDMYVYDAEGKAIGKISRNGEASSFTNQNIGEFDRGFVIKGSSIIARGNRDYNIRDNSRLVLGELQLDGKVLDNLNNEIGHLSLDGEIVNFDNEKIAVATPLQFYSLTVKHTKDLKKIYDKDGNLIGYLDENGNLVDADGNIIGRVDAGGNILDLNGNVVGQVGDKDGVVGTMSAGQDVYNVNGEKIGTVDSEGNVVGADGKVLGTINEKGQAIDADGNIIGGIGDRWFEKPDIIKTFEPSESKENKISNIDDDKDISPALKLLEESKYRKSLGIALTPDGEYLGDILEDDTVVNKAGRVVGYRTPDGLVVDEDGELIGIEEISDMDDAKDEERENGIFVPAGSFGPGGAYGVGNGSAANLGPGGGFGPGERYDPARQAALNAAMQERRGNISVGKISSGIRKEAFDGYQKDWSEQGIPKSISSWRVDMSEMIFSDKPIPAVIARAIDTNNPAPITAYVERNVYAEEGRNVIIPAGSRLIGSFGSITAATEATSESARVQIAWERLIRPDGSIFVFTGQTADAQGRAGALGYVDQQLFKKYTLPTITTVLSSAASYFIASAEDAAGEVETSKQQAATDARQNFLDNMESLFDDILADKTDVKARTYIPAGTRIIVYPNTDLWLRTVERDEEESNKMMKPEIFLDDTSPSLKTDAEKKKELARNSEGVEAGSSVVYDPEEVDAQSVSESPSVFIDDTAGKKKNKNLVPPPPPNSGSFGAPSSAPVASTPSSASTSSTSADSTSSSGIPALF